MSDLSALRKPSPEIETRPQDLTEGLKSDLRAERTRDLRKKASSLGGLKITSVTKPSPATPAAEAPLQTTQAAPEEKETFDLDEESVLVLSPASRVPLATTGKAIKALYIVAGAVTALWVTYCVAGNFISEFSAQGIQAGLRFFVAILFEKRHQQLFIGRE